MKKLTSCLASTDLSMLSGSFSLHSLDYSTLKNTYRFTDYNIMQLHRQKTAWNKKKTTNIVKWEKHTSISYGQHTYLYSFFKPFQCHWHTGMFSCFCPMSPKSDRNARAIPKEHLSLSVWFSPFCITKNKPLCSFYNIRERKTNAGGCFTSEKTRHSKS